MQRNGAVHTLRGSLGFHSNPTPLTKMPEKQAECTLTRLTQWGRLYLVPTPPSPGELSGLTVGTHTPTKVESWSPRPIDLGVEVVRALP